MFSKRIKELLNKETGSILPIFAVVVAMFFLVSAFAIDYARYIVASEKLLTATESAAISASLTAKRYVKLEVDPGSERDCCPDGEGGCRPCCKKCRNKKIVTGREDELLNKKGYKKYCCSCGCPSPKILDRWVEYERNGSDASSAAISFFNINRPSEMSPGQGGSAQITSVEAVNNKSDPRYPSVVVESRGNIKTLLMGIVNVFYPKANYDYLEAERCAQGFTFYYDTKGNWSRAPREGCE